MDVRSQILSHARRLFAGRGFSATSVQEVADAVGIRKPSLLYHFHSKEELREEVLKEMLLHWNAVLPQLVLRTSRDGEFEALIHALCEFFLDDPDRARLFLREILDRPDELMQSLATSIAPWIEIIATQLEEAKARGHVMPDVDAVAYTVQIVTMVVSGIAVLDVIHPHFTSIRSEELTDLQARDRHVRELMRIARTSLFPVRAPRTSTSS